MTCEASSIASSGLSCRHRSSASTSNEPLYEQSQISSIEVGVIPVGEIVLEMSDRDWGSEWRGATARVGLLEVVCASMKSNSMSCNWRSYTASKARRNSCSSSASWERRDWKRLRKCQKKKIGHFGMGMSCDVLEPMNILRWFFQGLYTCLSSSFRAS